MTEHAYRIVAGYDYSPTADLAVKRAFDLASKEERGEVHVVTVVVQMGEFVGAGFTGAATSPALPLEDAYEALEARVGQLMSEWQDETRKTFSRLVIHVRSEVPAAEIAQLAADLEAEMVVVGTHGRRGLRRLLLGSVAEGVVRLAHCPVLVVRPQDTEPSVPQIEPPCPKCVETRKQTNGEQFWCEQHRERHGQRHTYHYENRVGQPTNSPLVVGQNRR